MIAGRVAADIGSTIAATGALSIGDAASPDGFFSRGELRVLDHTVALLDSNQAVLGSLTRLGNAGVGGALNSPHGILLDFGNNIVGFGTINTPNDVLRPAINNGVITGNSPVEKITLTGYIKGVGSLDNVLVAGTSSPGFSPAAVYFGSVDFGSTSKLIAELEGLLPGSSGYDQLNFSGTAAPAGTLNVELINGFVPNVGNTFTLITAAGGITGAFDAMMLPGLPEYWYWQPTYSASELRLSVQTTRPRHNSRNPLDVTGDGHVAPNDALAVINRINAFGSGPPPPNPNNLPDFYDTSGDNFIGPNDALRGINAINAGQGGEGPSDSLISSAASPSINWAALLDLLALDIAERGAARKFR